MSLQRQADCFDVAVVGAGPAGSVAALVLARGGARVALVDKARFPRDKACGDLIGPRGVKVLDDLGIRSRVADAKAPSLGDMLVVGPTGKRVRLPSVPGVDYPGCALAIPRHVLDEALRTCALDEGACDITARAGRPIAEEGRLCGFELDDGRRVRAQTVIGADGATSRVAECAGLCENSRILWGFAIRCRVDHEPALPTIVMWEPRPRRGLCGYGWVFPGPEGVANVGLGVGTLSERSAGSQAVRLLPEFLEHLSRIGLLPEDLPPTRERLGGWLKMGMVGTRPASEGVLLVGDAAGLVNPLQGEGIAHAMTSARSAAESVLQNPAEPASLYRRRLAESHLPYQQVASAFHRVLLQRPRAVSAAGRMLTHPAIGTPLAGGWALFWNELLDGAVAGRSRSLAAAATFLGSMATSVSTTKRWFAEALGDSAR